MSSRKKHFQYRDVRSSSGRHLFDCAEWKTTDITLIIEEVASPNSMTSEFRSDMDWLETAPGPPCAANGSVSDSALTSYDNPNSENDDVSSGPADDSFFDTWMSSLSDTGGSGMSKDDGPAYAEYVAGFIDFLTAFVRARCMLNSHKFRLL